MTYPSGIPNAAPARMPLINLKALIRYLAVEAAGAGHFK